MRLIDRYIGITALVDEATGYQYEREKDELQKILKAYISEELLQWQKTFPEKYYQEIFRLNGWDFTLSSIKKRPGVVGIWTNKLIYEQLPKGCLKSLKRKLRSARREIKLLDIFKALRRIMGGFVNKT